MLALPVAISTVSTVTSLAGKVGGVVGLTEARTRSPSANKALRVQALSLAVADARAGSEEAYQVIRQWAGLMPNGSIPAEWPARYPGPQGNGAWPGADGSKQMALDAATALEKERATGSGGLALSTAAVAAGFGARLPLLLLIGGAAFLAFRYFRK